MKKTQTYETDSAYLKRLREDFFKNSEIIQLRTNIKPRVMVWPYGQYNGITLQVAREAGMPITINLNDGFASVSRMNQINRRLIDGWSNKVVDLAWLLTNWQPETAIRAVRIKLDEIYDSNSQQQTKYLDALMERIKTMTVNTVYLQAFANMDGDGIADAVYFPNRHLPMRANLFNYVAWQLHIRAGIENVFAWMPVRAFKLSSQLHLETRRQIIGEIYEDIAKHAWFNGLSFGNDTSLNDLELLERVRAYRFIK
jgi:biofilm PGA synthesis lipoprotein PgaB